MLSGSCPNIDRNIMSSHQDLLYHAQDGVAHIVLNKPEKKNALNPEMRTALWQALASASADADVRAVLISGAGNDFCSGGDISVMATTDSDAEGGRTRIDPVTRGARSLLELQKPVIVAVDGCAYGIGFSLALAADVVVATPRSRFCLSFMRLGLVPDGLALFTLPRVIGWTRAKKMLYSAQEIDGQTASDYGIVTELAAPETLLARASAVATALASASPAAFALTKNALLRSFSSDASAVMDMEINGQGIAYSTRYHKDAVRAFMRKQPLAFSWPGRG